MNSNGLGTVAAVGLGLFLLYLVASNIPTITIPTPPEKIR